MYQEIKILKMKTHIVSLDSVLKFILESKRSNKTQIGKFICVSNVHMCMLVNDSPSFASIVNSADLVIPDGKPISVAQKLLGFKFAQQVRGEDITEYICSNSGQRELKLGFYGGSSERVLNKLEKNLVKKYPDIKIEYKHSPPFRPLTDSEDRDIISEIEKKEIDVLFVGLGCPKQEKWMYEHKKQLGCVMLGVGAVFDFIADEKPHAPRILQDLGLEWFFRLCCEPKRLWYRYLSTNPRFILFFIFQLVFRKRR